MSRLIVTSELQRLSLTELWAIHAKVQQELVRSPADSAQRRNALASLENIRRAINTRTASPGP